MKINIGALRFFILTGIILLAPIHVLAMPDNPGDILNIPSPKFSVSEAIKRIIDYTAKDKTIAGNDSAANYVVVSAVYGRPDELFQEGSLEITDKNSEPSWFVTLRSSKTDSKRIYRLMDDGTILRMMHLD